MIDETPTIEDVLTAWSDASLAAELARRLARAGDTAVGNEPEAAAVPEVESLIKSTLHHATEAAAIAKGTGDRLQGARGAARSSRRQDAVDTSDEEASARGGDHEAERETRPHGDAKP